MYVLLCVICQLWADYCNNDLLLLWLLHKYRWWFMLIHWLCKVPYGAYYINTLLDYGGACSFVMFLCPCIWLRNAFPTSLLLWTAYKFAMIIRILEVPICEHNLIIANSFLCKVVTQIDSKKIVYYVAMPPFFLLNGKHHSCWMFPFTFSNY